MHIKKALELKINQIVNYPADRGESAGTGKIRSMSKTINKNIHGVEYIWVTVQMFGKSAVWPSNRLQERI